MLMAQECLYAWEAHLFDCHVAPDFARASNGLVDHEQRASAHNAPGHPSAHTLRAVSASDKQDATGQRLVDKTRQILHEPVLNCSCPLGFAVEVLPSQFSGTTSTSTAQMYLPCNGSGWQTLWYNGSMNGSMQGSNMTLPRCTRRQLDEPPLHYYGFLARQHTVPDIVHTRMCETVPKIYPPPGANDSIPYIPEWQYLPSMPHPASYAGCFKSVQLSSGAGPFGSEAWSYLGLPSTCHERASCAISFNHTLRDLSNSDPYYDVYMSACAIRTEEGIVAFSQNLVCRNMSTTPPSDCVQCDPKGLVAQAVCVCDRGYVGSGKCCQDRQECLDASHNCHVHATCSDCWTQDTSPWQNDSFACNVSVGSFACTCNTGYHGDGVDCLDINECNQMHTCHRNAECHNVQGSFYCTCHDGFLNLPDTSLPVGIECYSDSRVGVERVFMSGQDVSMYISWHDKTGDKNRGNVLALFKHSTCWGDAVPGCTRGMRQLWWAYTSSTLPDSSGLGCIKPMARCAADTTCQYTQRNLCLYPGQVPNLQASQFFQMWPIGFGEYTLMLWSSDLNELIALSTFSIQPPTRGPWIPDPSDPSRETGKFGADEEGLGGYVPYSLDHIVDDTATGCTMLGGGGAYRILPHDLGKAIYCSEGAARYGTSQSTFLNDTHFTAFGGLVDCIGRHYACSDASQNCSSICRFDPTDRFHVPVRPLDDTGEGSTEYAPFTCGDGRLTLASIEQCDDKNTISGDGCDERCQLEPGWVCTYTYCTSPRTMQCADSMCASLPACGDGYVQPQLGEECDDYNLVKGDGLHPDHLVCANACVCASMCVRARVCARVLLSK